MPVNTIQIISHGAKISSGAKIPRLVFMGDKRSGKTSIRSVVFQKLPASETLFIEPTNIIAKAAIDSYFNYEIWDLPGQFNFLDPSFSVRDTLGKHGVLVWVIDAQDDYFGPLHQLMSLVVHVRKKKLKNNIHVFIHKTDDVSEEYRQEIKEEVIQRLTDELRDYGFNDTGISYHFTSIHDHSVCDALSKVITQFTPHLQIIESMLDLLCMSSGIHKAFLFDFSSKIFIATDSSPVDMPTFGVCSDFIDFITGFSEIYGNEKKKEKAQNSSTGSNVVDQIRYASSFAKLESSVLYLKQVHIHLSLVCLMSIESTQKPGVLDYNTEVFQAALEKIFELGGERGG